MVKKKVVILRCKNCEKRLFNKKPYRALMFKNKEGGMSTYLFCSKKCADNFIALKKLKVKETDRVWIEPK